MSSWRGAYLTKRRDDLTFYLLPNSPITIHGAILMQKSALPLRLIQIMSTVHNNVYGGHTGILHIQLRVYFRFLCRMNDDHSGRAV
jgi:hypothetical protein